MAEKTYCGQGQIKENKYGQFVKVLLFPDDLKAIGDRVRELKAQGKDKEPVNLTFFGKKEPRNDWTHYGCIDTWEPDPERVTPKPEPEPEPGGVFDDDDAAPTQGGEDGLPF